MLGAGPNDRLPRGRGVAAPAILLLHGPPGSSAEYDTLIRALNDKYHLIASDCIGFGASEAP